MVTWMTTGRLRLTRVAAGLAVSLLAAVAAEAAPVAAEADPAVAEAGAAIAEAHGAGARHGGADWPMWQHDPSGSRYNAAEQTINRRTVATLTPRWAFVFPDSGGLQSSQPAVVDGTVYVGGHNGRMYALDARTGATRWSFDTATVAGAPDPEAGNPLRDGPVVVDRTVYFGDSTGRVYALDRRSGKPSWVTRVDSHPGAIITGSPLVWHGRLVIGVSSREYMFAGNDAYPCCTFRGGVAALDARSGRLLWHRYTTPPPQRTGTTSDGVPVYGPSGAAVWSSPAVDPATGTVFVGTGNNYTGTAGDSDSVLALDLATGATRWSRQMTHPDTWTFQCFKPPNERCPNPGPDFDFGASPNVFRVAGRTLVGIGQKSGVYHVFDARTGAVAWQTSLSTATTGFGSGGIQWGTSFDGTRIYAATYHARPGTLYALRPATGEVLWQTPLPADACTTGGAAGRPDTCDLAHISAPSTVPGVVFEGSEDGRIRGYDSRTGGVLWQYDTVRPWTGINGLAGAGGSISGVGGPVVANGMLFVNSGYWLGTGIRGGVLIAFGTAR
jgi:polyvinyl alcohol dehydrogenase (cytochrome)